MRGFRERRSWSTREAGRNDGMGLVCIDFSGGGVANCSSEEIHLTAVGL